MNFFERFLSLWVLLCIVLGVVLGQGFPAVFQSLGDLQVARINLPVGVLIWVMIIPMLVKIDFGALHEVRRHVRGIGADVERQFAVLAELAAARIAPDHRRDTDRLRLFGQFANLFHLLDLLEPPRPRPVDKVYTDHEGRQWTTTALNWVLQQVVVQVLRLLVVQVGAARLGHHHERAMEDLRRLQAEEQRLRFVRLVHRDGRPRQLGQADGEVAFSHGLRT